MKSRGTRQDGRSGEEPAGSESIYSAMHAVMQFALQKQNVVVRLSRRVLRKLEEFEKREDLPDRTTAVTLLVWKGLRDYERRKGLVLGGKKTTK